MFWRFFWGAACLPSSNISREINDKVESFLFTWLGSLHGLEIGSAFLTFPAPGPQKGKIRLSIIRYSHLILPPYTHLDPTTLTFTQRFLEKTTKSQKVPARHPPAGRCWFSAADFIRSLGQSKSQKGQENATLHSTFSNRLAGFCHILECTSPWCHSAELKIKTTSENFQPITVQQGVMWSSVQTRALSFWKKFLLSQKIHTKTSGDQRFDWKINNFSWAG